MHRRVMLLSVNKAMMVFSFERGAGGMIGSHSVVLEDELSSVQSRLLDLAEDWRREPMSDVRVSHCGCKVLAIEA